MLQRSTFPLVISIQTKQLPFDLALALACIPQYSIWPTDCFWECAGALTGNSDSRLGSMGMYNIPQCRQGLTSGCFRLHMGTPISNAERHILAFFLSAGGDCSTGLSADVAHLSRDFAGSELLAQPVCRHLQSTRQAHSPPLEPPT